MSIESGPAACPYTTGTFGDVSALLRSRSVVNSPEVNVGLHDSWSELGELNLHEFVEGILPFVDGDVHRNRRKVLNTLVRPRSLESLREDVVLPAVRRQMATALSEPAADGTFSCDLAAVVERVFLEFSARLIGLRGLKSDDAITDLRSCVLPLFAGLISIHFEDRAAVLERALVAKRKYVEKYYRPALKFHQDLYARYQAGDIDESELPMNVMRMIVSGAVPEYGDEAQAIRESMLFFIAATGTSTQAVLSTVYYLSRWFEKHPEDIPLRQDLGFLSHALQESLRLRAPYISYATRLATDEIEIGDKTVSKGQELHLQLPSAGRDQSVYGADASEFNPWRTVPEGVARYGIGFANGPHSCLGLRVVLGNDGKGGSHIKLLQGLFEAGVRMHPTDKPTELELRDTDDVLPDMPTYRTFPVVFDRWPVADGGL